MAKKDIIEAPAFNLAAMETGVDEIRDLIVSNIGDEGLDSFDLSRAINPGSGGAEWKIPDIDGEPEMTDSITGVIVYHRLVRAYWPGEYKPNETGPPDCSSKNAKFGEGAPGGDCSSCALAVFGSGKNNSQACRAMKQIFIIREGELLPTCINITAVNIAVPKRYLLGLLSKRRLRYNQVVTNIQLTPDVSTSGFDYSKTNFSMVSVLDPDQQKAMIELTEIFKPMLSEQPVIIEVEAELMETVEDPVQEPDF